MAAEKPLKIAIVAGEESGDLLGADIVQARKRMTGREVRLVDIG
ncbi:lipid-A-disaccharide synthase, partial [Mesorhizobium sp. M4B.F.Ca.ET.200.01.1.1]